MAPLTACAFILTAAAVALPELHRTTRGNAIRLLSVLAGAVALFIASFVLLGYLAQSPVGFSTLSIPMACLSGVGFFIFNLGTVLSNWCTEFAGSHPQEDSISAPSINAAPRTQAIGFTVFGVVGILIVFFFLRAEQTRIRNTLSGELRAIPEIKVQEITNWRQGRIGDAMALASNPSIAGFIASTPGGGPDAAEIDRYLAKVLKAYHYRRIVLFDKNYRAVWGTPKGAGWETPPSQATQTTIATTNAVATEDLHRSEDGRVEMHFVAPIDDAEARARVGVVMLTVDAESQLFVKLGKRPSEQTTAEELLVRREGDALLYLNELRLGAIPAFTLRKPLADPKLLAAIAMRSDTRGLIEALDYRGVPTFGYAMHVPDSPWVLIAKVDQAEAFAPARQFTGALLLTFILVAFLTILIVRSWQDANTKRQLEASLKSERLLRAATERLAMIMRYARDAIIVFDSDKRVTDANNSALKTYGYSLEEFRQLSANDLRAVQSHDLVNKQFLQATDKDGVSFESAHCKKDGSAFKVEVSAKSIVLAGKVHVLSIIRDVSERKAAEEALRASEHKFASVLESMAEGVVVQDAEGKIVSANKAAQEFLGRTAKELVGRSSLEPIWGAVHDDGSLFPGETHPMVQTLSTGVPASHVVMGIVRPDGSRRWLSINTQPIEGNPKSKPAWVIATFRDFTATRANRQEITRLNKVYTTISRVNNAMIHIRDRHKLLTEVCRILVREGGYMLAWVGLRDPVTNRICPDAVEGDCVDYISKVEISTDPKSPFGGGPTGRCFQSGVTCICNDFLSDPTTLAWHSHAINAGIRSSIALPLRSGGSIAGVLTVYSSVKDFFQPAESALLNETAADLSFALEVIEGQSLRYKSEEMLKNVLNTAPQAVFWKDLDGRYLGCNKTYARFVGLRLPEELIGLTDLDLPMPRSEAERYREDDKAVIRRQEAMLHYVEEVHLANSETRWVNTSEVPLRDGRGEVYGVLGVFEDVTLRVKTEAENRKNEQRIRLQSAALEAAVNNVMITDAKGAIEWVNPAFSRTTGYRLEEVQGKNPRVLKSGRTPAAVYTEMWAYLRAGQSWSGEFVNVRKDGTFYTQESTITPVFDSSGVLTHFVAVTLDVTEQRMLQAQLNETQRLEGIGLLASGIAHDLNNILSPIMLSMELLRTRYPAEERVLAIVHQCAQRGSEIVKQVLAFSRGLEGPHTPISIGRLVKEMVRLMSETFPRNIAISCSVERAMDTVLADPTQIHQVLLNLAVNARDAMPNGGKLTFELSNEKAPSRLVGPEPGGGQADFVVIAISDTGAGIPPDVLPRIFEPFFSTKPRGKGTGLGLSTVHGIVKSHGGFIRVESQVGIGSVFRVFLPFVHGREPAPTATETCVPVEGNGKMVLIVDDEPLVLETARSVVEKHGFKAVTAENGEMAISAFRANAGDIRFVLLDRMMPDMNGEAVALVIHGLAPNVPIVLSTGLVTEIGTTSSESVFKEAGILHLLPKPYSEDKLLGLLREHT